MWKLSRTWRRSKGPEGEVCMLAQRLVMTKKHLALAQPESIIIPKCYIRGCWPVTGGDVCGHPCLGLASPVCCERLSYSLWCFLQVCWLIKKHLKRRDQARTVQNMGKIKETCVSVSQRPSWPARVSSDELIKLISRIGMGMMWY